MSAFDISIDIRDELTQPLRRLKEAGGDLRRPFADISEAVHEHTQDRFDQEFGPDGIPWEVPKRYPVDPSPTLVQGGDLRNNIEHESGEDFAQVGIYQTAGPAKYARAHQEGVIGTQSVKAHQRTVTKAFGKPLAKPVRVDIGAGSRQMNLPARPFLGIESRDLTVTEKIILDHLARAADGNGSGGGAA